jgi:hypothetical protein
MLAVGGAFATVTLDDAEVVEFPAESHATAVTVCVPSATVVVFHVCVYGALVTGAPRLAPSIRSCTLATPMLSLAAAVTLTAVPETVALLAGAVTLTVGGVVSAFITVTPTAADVVWFPAASRATAASV